MGEAPSSGIDHRLDPSLAEDVSVGCRCDTAEDARPSHNIGFFQSIRNIAVRRVGAEAD
jgi:hypothetical protein